MTLLPERPPAHDAAITSAENAQNDRIPAFYICSCLKQSVNELLEPRTKLGVVVLRKIRQKNAACELPQLDHKDLELGHRHVWGDGMHHEAEHIAIWEGCESFCCLSVDVCLVLLFEYNSPVGGSKNPRVGDASRVQY